MRILTILKYGSVFVVVSSKKFWIIVGTGLRLATVEGFPSLFIVVRISVWYRYIPNILCLCFGLDFSIYKLFDIRYILIKYCKFFDVNSSECKANISVSRVSATLKKISETFLKKVKQPRCMEVLSNMTDKKQTSFNFQRYWK